MTTNEAYRKCAVCKRLLPEGSFVKVKVETYDAGAALANGMGIGGDRDRSVSKEIEKWVCKDCVSKNNERRR